MSNVFIENSKRLDYSPGLYHSLLRLASNKRNIVVSFVCYSMVTYHKSLNSASYLHLLAFVSVLFIEKIQWKSVIVYRLFLLLFFSVLMKQKPFPGPPFQWPWWVITCSSFAIVRISNWIWNFLNIMLFFPKPEKKTYLQLDWLHRMKCGCKYP